MSGKSEEEQPLLDRLTINNSGIYKGSLPPSPLPSLLQINRPLYQQDDLHDATLYQRPRRNTIRNSFSCNPLLFLLQTIPVLHWLPKYKWRENILYDILSGITVAIMHIPQGMAYGLLGNVPPVVGIYMAFFPVLVYFIFGTSRHVSIGTFAIVCLMTGKVVSTHGSDEILWNGTVIRMPTMDDGPSYSNIEVAITVTFTVAMIMFVMYSFRLGIVANLLSETLVNGFTCACAFHVVASQMKDLFGLPVKKRRGMFGMILSIYDAILALPEANRSAVSISLVVIVITVINNEILKPRLAKKTRIPFPIELVAVVLGTAVSYFMDFNGNYNISIVGEIPTGMPAVTLPVFTLMPNIIFESVIIAIVSYAISISMALIFANKSQYDIDANQELFALGCANVVGSFFTCMPIAASLSRSSIQHAVGGVTQIASVVSCGLLFLVLLWIGPAFTCLPRCVLASIIIVALKSMLTQCLLLPRFWKMSKCDGIIWLVTFLTTTIVSIDVGLGAGIVASLGTLLYRGQAPYTCLLGALPDTDIYLDVDRYKGVMEVPGVKIFHYCGGLNFASRANFKALLYSSVGFERSSKKDVDRNGAEHLESQTLFTKCIVVDCSALTYVDPAGVEQLRFILDEFKQAGVELFIASCSAPVFETFKRCDKHQKVETHFQIFPCVHDAVMYAKLLHFRLGKDV